MVYEITNYNGKKGFENKKACSQKSYDVAGVSDIANKKVEREKKKREEVIRMIREEANNLGW